MASSRSRSGSSSTSNSEAFPFLDIQRPLLWRSERLFSSSRQGVELLLQLRRALLQRRRHAASGFRARRALVAQALRGGRGTLLEPAAFHGIARARSLPSRAPRGHCLRFRARARPGYDVGLVGWGQRPARWPPSGGRSRSALAANSRCRAASAASAASSGRAGGRGRPPARRPSSGAGTRGAPSRARMGGHRRAAGSEREAAQREQGAAHAASSMSRLRRGKRMRKCAPGPSRISMRPRCSCTYSFTIDRPEAAALDRRDRARRRRGRTPRRPSRARAPGCPGPRRAPRTPRRRGPCRA